MGLFLDDELLFEIFRPTVLPFYQIGTPPTGITWDTAGATTYVEGPIQWTFNNYMTGAGPWSPVATTIYWDDPQVVAV